jgi:hypothetical protein
MGKWRNAIAMDLIRWFRLFFDSLWLLRSVTENPKILMDIPLTMTRFALVQNRNGTRLRRGPASLNRRLDL